MMKKLTKERLIQKAKVIVALERLDLALILWAVRGSSRTRILEELLEGALTGPQIIQRTGVSECSTYRDLGELMDAGLVVIIDEIKGHGGPWTSVYEIAPGHLKRRESEDYVMLEREEASP